MSKLVDPYNSNLASGPIYQQSSFGPISTTPCAQKTITAAMTTIEDLPNELLLAIFAHLPRHLLVNVAPLVCHRWRHLAAAPFLWRRIELGSNFDEDFALTEAFMHERGFESVVNEFHLTIKNPLSDEALEKLERMLRVCR